MTATTTARDPKCWCGHPRSLHKHYPAGPYRESWGLCQSSGPEERAKQLAENGYFAVCACTMDPSSGFKEARR